MLGYPGLCSFFHFELLRLFFLIAALLVLKAATTPRCPTPVFFNTAGFPDLNCEIFRNSNTLILAQRETLQQIAFQASSVVSSRWRSQHRVAVALSVGWYRQTTC